MAGVRRAGAWRYSQWDGSQEPVELDADDVLSSVADDLLYHGDLDAALRRVLQQGFTTPSSERVAGLRDLLARLQARREELLSGNDLSGLYDDVRRRLDEVLDTERSELDRAAAAAGPDDEEAARRAAEAHTELDLLPDELARQIGALSRYEFSSPLAQQRFEELVADLRRDLAQLQLDRTAGAMASAGPEEREHLRAGLDALNKMLEQRAAGEPIDPSFEQFMQQFGDMFPEAGDLDELLQRMAERMAAASALVASMTPEQRAELAALADELMSDMDLGWQLDRLGANLRNALPSLPWDRGVAMSGGDPLGLGEAGDVFAELARLDQLGQMLRGAAQPGELAEVDPASVAELLGPDAAAALETLASLTRRLEEQGLVARREGRLSMTPKGLRRLGSRALDELFSRLRRDRVGEHPVASAGIGHDRSDETKAYEYGDPMRLDVQKTLRNALLRSSSSSEPLHEVGSRPASLSGSGRSRSRLPIALVPDDFEIEQSEHLSTASTVLAVDLSLSMPMRDNFLAAKKVAMALQSLIASRYPRDYLGLVGFSATAREIQPRELPEVSWDFAYGTNLQHALALSRRMLGGKAGAKQVIVITDGEPTAHVLEGGDVFFDYPPAPETLEATLGEVARCTRAKISINTFVLDATGSLRAFVEQMTKMNRGRAFFTTPDDLGGYVLVDFVEQRASRTRRIARGN
jgi:uncharacterized protein with von Willebrand factor type A (vWA) domain